MSFAALFSLTLLSALHGVASLPSALGPSGQVAAAWYTSWHASGVPNAFPDTAIPWEKYNTVIYSFAVTTPDVNTISLSGSDASLYDFVARARAHNVAAHVGIGGWGGSMFFSSNVATPENRTAFVTTVADFAAKYGLSGIEFDWEFPNKQGIGCNKIDADDTQNFLYFLQELRKNPVGAKLTLTAAVSIAPFNDASGNPSKDVSDFAKVFDYIVVMDYDIWGKWSPTVGPNSPLDDTCADPANQAGSAVSAVKAWTAAGIPVNQIVLGVPSYGHSFSVSPSDAFVYGSQTELAPNPKFDASKQPLGDAWGNAGGADACGVQEGPGGTFELWGLVDGGFLATDGNPAPGISYRYDTCSQTPYVYNPTSQVMVSFDNADSFAAKGKYIQKTGLKGFSMWEAGGDYNDILLDSIRTAAGY
ncbi:glycoside hydrolase family 18 protein [Boletus edulis]|nr:glycoside hydrolase family 18 protein [Boletus edulis]